MDIVLLLHSLVRWVVVVVAVAALVKFALGFMQKAPPAKIDRALMSGLSGLIDLQALLGIILLGGTYLLSGSFAPYRVEHAITMVLAVVVAHAPMRWRKSEESTVLRNNALTILAVLILVIVGVLLLPQGWFRSDASL